MAREGSEPATRFLPASRRDDRLDSKDWAAAAAACHAVARWRIARRHAGAFCAWIRYGRARARPAAFVRKPASDSERAPFAFRPALLLRDISDPGGAR